MEQNESATETETFETSPLEVALADQVEVLVGERDHLIAETTELQRKFADQEQQNMRLMADFDNFRRRTQREKDELGAFVTTKILAEILPVLDNFERARSFAQPENEREEKLHASYQQVYRQFLGILEKLGVQPMDVVGKPFDFTMHEALMREESQDVTQETIVAELQKGYALGDKVLRPAMVKVAVPAAAGQSSFGGPEM